MSLDPQIPLSGIQPRFNDPFAVLSQYRQQAQEREYLQQQMRSQQALEEQRRQEQRAKQQTIIDTKTIDAMMQNAMTQNDDGQWVIDRPKFQAAVVQAGLGSRMPEYAQQLDNMDAAIRKTQDAHKNALAELGFALGLGDHSPDTVMLGVAPYLKNGILKQDEIAPYIDAINKNPNMTEQVAQQLMALDPAVLSRWDSRKTAAATQAKTAAETKKLEMEIAGTLPKTPAQMADDERMTLQLKETERHNRAMEARPVAGVVQAGQTESDADSIAQAIASGSQPPEVTGLYRLAGPVRAALAKQGYDLTKANLDWQATKKHVSTLNGAQQTRVRQAIATAADSLDVIDGLAEQWKGGNFPLLNKANLALARNGAYGQQAASIATQLEGQITDVVSELANVYMGGNSPTDHALQLAEKNLRADWSERVLRDMTKLARTNLTIRRNSMEHVGPAGLSSATPQATPTTPSAPAPKLPPINERVAGVTKATINGKPMVWNGRGWRDQ